MRKMCSLVPNDLTTHFDFKTPKILKITLQAMKKKKKKKILTFLSIFTSPTLEKKVLDQDQMFHISGHIFNYLCYLCNNLKEELLTFSHHK